MELTHLNGWEQSAMRADLQLAKSVEKCRLESPVPCKSWHIVRTIQEEYLQPEYQNTRVMLIVKL
jgi:hypothetical protein